MVLSVNSNSYAIDMNSQFLHSFNTTLNGTSYYKRAFAVYCQKLVARKDGGVLVIEGYGHIDTEQQPQNGINLSIYMEQIGSISSEIPIFTNLQVGPGHHSFAFKVVMGVGTACHNHTNNVYSEFQLSGGEKHIDGMALPNWDRVTTADTNIWTFSLKYQVPSPYQYELRVGRIVTEYLETGE